MKGAVTYQLGSSVEQTDQAIKLIHQTEQSLICLLTEVLQHDELSKARLVDQLSSIREELRELRETIKPASKKELQPFSPTIHYYSQIFL